MKHPLAKMYSHQPFVARKDGWYYLVGAGGWGTIQHLSELPSSPSYRGDSLYLAQRLEVYYEIRRARYHATYRNQWLVTKVQGSDQATDYKLSAYSPSYGGKNGPCLVTLHENKDLKMDPFLHNHSAKLHQLPWETIDLLPEINTQALQAFLQERMLAIEP
jgi:hypothetical protein